jgi:hypothetical protein
MKVDMSNDILSMSSNDQHLYFRGMIVRVSPRVLNQQRTLNQAPNRCRYRAFGEDKITDLTQKWDPMLLSMQSKLHLVFPYTNHERTSILGGNKSFQSS